MNKKYIIRKNEEIKKIIDNSKKLVNQYYIVYCAHNDLNYNRFCVSVSKKLGKAHTRNLYKRRIKDILMKNNVNYSNDYVIILRNSILSIDYNTMKDELLDLLKGESK